MKKIVLFFVLLGGLAFAQNTPLILGSTLDIGAGVLSNGDKGVGALRIMPFTGAWISGLGYLRCGYGVYQYTETPDSSEEIEVKHRDLSIQLGIGLGTTSTYLQGSYTRAKNLSNIGDVTWNEWGVGFGSTMQLSTMSAIVLEVEYRWILQHFDLFQNKSISGSRLQMNLGFVIYVY